MLDSRSPRIPPTVGRSRCRAFGRHGLECASFPEFYRAAAERDHEMGCLEAVRRTEESYRIVNLDELERKQVNGRTLITRKGSLERISGMAVRLSTDPP